MVCALDGHIAGMMLGYRLSSSGETPKLAGLCQSLRPLMALEARHPASFYLNTLAIYPGDRNRGLGAVLLGAAESRARKANCARMLLEVARDNEAALRFYARYGFTAWAETEGTAGIAVLEKDLCLAAGRLETR